ncbi:MAG: hypothetical protein ACREQI_03330, partial [Candidatus Binataceae bacterium]
NIPLCCSSVPRIPASSSTHNGHLSIYLGAERKAIIFPHPAKAELVNIMRQIDKATTTQKIAPLYAKVKKALTSEQDQQDLRLEGG